MKIHFVLTTVTLLSLSTIAEARSVSIWSYTIDTSQIQGFRYLDEGRQYLELRMRLAGSEMGLTRVGSNCKVPDDKKRHDKAFHKAGISLAKALNTEDFINPNKIMTEAGFSDCKLYHRAAGR